MFDIGDKVNIIDNNTEYVIIDTTKDREGNILYILADYETNEELNEEFYYEELILSE